MKGILLAGGAGTRLYPLTRAISKQLLPVYDKPAIYYPLSILMLMRIREVAIISTPRDLVFIQALLGDGSHLGMRFEYLEQARPEGIAQAFLIASQFIQDDSSCLVLGDNVFYGHNLVQVLEQALLQTAGAHVFAYRVHDPERYGVVEFDSRGKAISLEEKPQAPRSHWAVPGLYIYDHDVVRLVKSLSPSPRGELEITDLNRRYLEAEQLHVHPMGRGIAWLDVGTYDSLLVASTFIQTIEQRQGLKVACLEEIALRNGFVSPSQFERLVSEAGTSGYAQYLRQVAAEL